MCVCGAAHFFKNCETKPRIWDAGKFMRFQCKGASQGNRDRGEGKWMRPMERNPRDWSVDQLFKAVSVSAQTGLPGRTAGRVRGRGAWHHLTREGGTGFAC